MTREESMLVDAPDGAVLSRSVDAMEGEEGSPLRGDLRLYPGFRGLGCLPGRGSWFGGWECS